MPSRIGSLTLLLVLALARGLPVHAQTHIQELGAITAAAEDAVAARGPGIRARAAAPDPRLRLAACPVPLQASLPPAAKGARLSVRVICTAAVPWSVLVPVQVETTTKVVVAKRALVPGTVLGADDLAAQERRIQGFADCCAADPASLIGQRVKRPIPADAPIPLESLETAPVIRRGEMVTVIAGAPGFEVRSTGTAMADAKEGDAVRVRHATSLRVIHARADSRGVVRAER